MNSSRIGATGAEVIVNANLMLQSQVRYLKRILLHIHEIAESEAARERDERGAYEPGQGERRPHQVFLIDGARGSGKTTLLLTVQHYLQYLGRPKHWKSRCEEGSVQELLEQYTKEIRDELDADPSSRGKPFRGFEDEHVVDGVGRKTTFYLPILFPSDLELGQSVMEGILAIMARTLDQELSHCDQKNPDHKDRFKQGSELRDQIDRRVAAGWFLSRNEGTDAILRDSADYEEYLEKRGKANVDSFSRVETWRTFVNRYLNFFGAELLTVCFDDTDVATSISRDILHTARIFLDHPRIVTLVAGNLHSIRQSLVLYDLKSLGTPVEAISEVSARDWRRQIRHETEEFLEKVLPRRFRYYIASTQELASPASSAEAAAQRKNQGGRPNQIDSDFKRVFGTDFDGLCSEMLDRGRVEFLRMRHKAHLRWLEDLQEVVNEEEHGALENYLSWWTFRHWYAGHLRPRTVRHMAAMRAYTGRKTDKGFVVDLLPSEHRKRLAVMLFESPENYEIIHRLGDGDFRILSWLHRQIIESSWHGDRYLQINGRRIYEKTYSYHYLLFRLDLGIAMPVQENPEDTLPHGLLPIPDGPNLTKHRSFFSRSRGQRLYGVAGDLRHSLVPANCIYLCDVDVLPDAAWAPAAGPSPSESWERRLLYRWQQMFFFDLDELRAPLDPAGRPRGHRSKPSEVPTFDDQWVSRYLIDTVIPFASVPIGAFVPTADEFSDRSQPIDALAAASLLAAELAPGGHIAALPQIANLNRKYDYLEQVTRDLGGAGTSDLLHELLGAWRDVIIDPALPVTKPSGKSPRPGKSDDQVLHDLASRLTSYRWLVNDVRRAWHAARIFVHQSSTIARRHTADDGTTPQSGLDAPEATRKDRFFRDDRYTVGTRAALRRWLERSKTVRVFVDTFKAKTSHPELAITDEGPDGKGEFLRVDRQQLRHQTMQDIARVIGWSQDVAAPVLKKGAIDMTLDAEQVRAFLTSRRPDREMHDRLDFFLDPAAHVEAAQPSLASAQKSRTNSRLARSYSLFLYGFAPTLPALIHVELGAAAQAVGRSNRAELGAIGAAVLKGWEEQILQFMDFVNTYRRLLEVAKLRLDILELWELAYGQDATAQLGKIGLSGPLSPETFGVRMTLTPDMSFASLGVQGIANLPGLNFAGPELAGLQNACAEKRLLWDAVREKPGRATWRSELDDTYDNLVQALNFIRTMRRVLSL